MRITIIPLVVAMCALATPIVAQTVVNSWSTGGSFAGGLEFDSGTNTIWVADSTTDLIMQFDRSGVLLTSFPSPGSQAIGVAVDPVTGNVWVGDESEWVDEVTSAGVLTGNSWPTTPSITDVSGLAFNPTTGNIYVSQDSGTRQVAEFTPAGVFVGTTLVGGAGSVDPDGLAYNPVTDTFLLGEDTGDQIIEVDNLGGLLNSWSMSALGISPEGLGLDAAGGMVFISGGFDNMIYEVSGIIASGSLFTLSASGQPGSVMTFTVANATANGPVAYIYAMGTGTHGRMNPLTGNVVTTGLSSAGFTIAGIFSADGAGNFSLSSFVPFSASGLVNVQTVDALTDTVSNVISL